MLYIPKLRDNFGSGWVQVSLVIFFRKLSLNSLYTSTGILVVVYHVYFVSIGLNVIKCS